jgi:indole-3-glycerol phosphate synthase
LHVTGARRLSQAISEGEGISVIATVADAASARAAEDAGADGLAVRTAVSGIRDATALPILLRDAGDPRAADAAGADAWLLVVSDVDDEDRLEELYAEADRLGLECVIDVGEEDELELALERLDPEIFLLSPREADDDEDDLDRVLALLPDVPAGKLAIAELGTATPDELVALERAGVDAVLVGVPDVAELVGGEPPRV